MRKIFYFATSLVLAFTLLTAPDLRAQTARSRNSGSASTTRSSVSSASATRSVGSSNSSSTSRSVASASATRSSSSSFSAQQQDRTRSTNGSTTRSSGSSTSSSSTRSVGSAATTRSSSGSVSSSSQQQDNRRSTSGSTTRSVSGSSSSSTRSVGSAATTRSSSGSVSSSSQQQDNRRSTSGSTTRSVSGSATTRSVSGSATTRSVDNEAQTRSGNTLGQQQDNRKAGDSAPAGATIRSTNVTSGGLTSSVSSGSAPAQNNKPQDHYRDEGNNYRYNDGMRVDDSHNMYRVAPRHRDPMPWDRPGNYWGDHPHYYGYRIQSLPPTWRRVHHWGIDYYYYNGIYYRSFGGAYVICRPPFGTPLEVAIDRAILRALRFAYYVDTYRTYSYAFDYYNVIARQNLIIAQQNARLIAQNSAYALNSNRALTAYELAEKLGLVQSYANAGAEYFYQDGVFYTISASGVYTTIIPPAGALVTSLPDDYEVIVMNGIEYYMVDNTVYRTTVFEGEPYLEVLGQMYGAKYNQYDFYR